MQTHLHTNIETSCKCGSGKMPMVRTGHWEFCDTCGESQMGRVSVGLFFSAIFTTLLSVFQQQ